MFALNEPCALDGESVDLVVATTNLVFVEDAECVSREIEFVEGWVSIIPNAMTV